MTGNEKRYKNLVTMLQPDLLMIEGVEIRVNKRDI